MRKCDRHAGQAAGQNFAHAALVLRVEDGPQKANSHGFNFEQGQLIGDVRDRRLVERTPDFAGGRHALRNFECEGAGDVRIGIGHGVIERLKPSTFPQYEDVRMTTSHQQRRLCRLFRHDCIDGVGGTVDEHLAAIEQRAAVDLKLRGRNRQTRPAPPLTGSLGTVAALNM